MYVGQVMTRKVVTTTPGESIDNAFASMLKKKIAHLPVVGKNGIVGIISDRDLRKAKAGVKKTRGKGNGLLVKDVMISDVVTADKEMHVTDAVSLMLRLKIGSLPVVDKNKIKGIITKDDLLAVFLEMLRMLQASSTLDVELVDEVEDVAAVFSVLKKHKASVLSYSATPSMKGRRQTCHFRLKLCPIKPIVKDLKNKGVKVLDAYGDD